jgi:hypothetical protein
MMCLSLSPSAGIDQFGDDSHRAVDTPSEEQFISHWSRKGQITE